MKQLVPGLLLVGACTTETPPGAVGDCLPSGRPECPAPGGDFVDPLVHLGRGDSNTFFEITDIVADGDTVYVCSGVRGLSIFDASSDAPSRYIEKVAPGGGLADPSFPRCQHVGLDRDAGRLAITNRGDEVQPTSWLAMFDVGNPSQPRELAAWVPDQGSIEGVALRGDRLYAAAHTRGIFVLEVDADGGLTELANVAPSGTDAWKPVLRDGLLFVADGEAGLRIYDVSDDDPRLVSSTPISGSSRDVVLDGDRAYVASSSTLAVVDVSTPAAAVVLAEHPTAGTALALARTGPATVVVAEWDALRGYDLSDPTAIRQQFSEIVPTDDDFSRVLAVEAVPDNGRVFGGEWTGLHQFSLREGSGPDIALDPGSVQFGNLGPKESSDRVMVIRNDGDQPLTVHDIVSAQGVSVDQSCFTVEPGRSNAVEVTLAPVAPGELQTRVRVCSDDPDQPEAEVSLTANAPGFGVGDPVPTFALQDLEGDTWTSADLDGKVAVLAYFATF